MSKKLNLGKIDYMAVSSEITCNAIRDCTVNQEIFFTIGLLAHNHLPVEVFPPVVTPFIVARINQTFASRNYVQKLREQASGESKYFNILSTYFERDEFNIDELELTREKLISRRKETLLGIASKEAIRG